MGRRGTLWSALTGLGLGLGLVACDGAAPPEAETGTGGITGATPPAESTGEAPDPTDDPTDDSASGSSGSTSGSGGSTSEGTGGAESSSTSGDGESESDSDDTFGTTTGVDPVVKCQAVDFLFVIDNSVSMGAEQEALVGAFPGFMDTITTELEAGSDFHVMVLDTDAWGRCNTANEPSFDGQSPTHSTCNDYVEMTEFDVCDGVRGAGVVHPAGDGATNALCTPSSGSRFIDNTEPDLGGMFACMATVGLAGHPSERPMNAIQAAFEPGGDAEACNEGFLREDALLVVTFISDDPGTEDDGAPMDWYDDLVAAKGGDPAGVVVLGLGPGGDECGNGGNHWLEFVELWGERGIHGPVCGSAEEYVQFFQDSVAVIDQACEEFVPG